MQIVRRVGIVAQAEIDHTQIIAGTRHANPIIHLSATLQTRLVEPHSCRIVAIHLFDQPLIVIRQGALLFIAKRLR